MSKVDKSGRPAPLPPSSYWMRPRDESDPVVLGMLTLVAIGTLVVMPFALGWQERGFIGGVLAVLIFPSFIGLSWVIGTAVRWIGKRL